MQPDEQPQQQPRSPTRVGGVIEEADRQEPEHERARLAPEPEVLVQHVEHERTMTSAASAMRLYYAIAILRIAMPTRLADAAGASDARRARRVGARGRRRGISIRRPAVRSGSTSPSKLGWDPRREISGFADLQRFGAFEDEWLRGGPVQRWVPKGLAGKPVYVFETGGTTGIPKTRIACDDFRTDYELFSDTLPDEYFPKGSNWLMLGPSGPRRLRLAVEHLAQYRGGICFCVDLDPRWVIKLIKKGWMRAPAGLQGSRHRPGGDDPAGRPRHPVHVHDAEAARGAGAAARVEGHDASGKAGITGIFSGGTEFTPQWNRFAHEELLDGAYMTPTYGNTLMGLAAQRAERPAQRLQDHLLRAAAARGHRGRRLRRPEQASSTTAQTGRVKLTTLTKEFFMPGFLERDEGEREPPYEKYPWDGVSGVRPFRGFAATTTVGVY